MSSLKAQVDDMNRESSERPRRRRLWRHPIVGVFLAFALLGAACMGSGSTGSGEGNATGPVPNPGVIVVALDDQPPTVDPAQVQYSGSGLYIVFQTYDRLLRIPAGSSELAPSLSTKVPSIDNGLISGDGLTYTFPIRKGVKFQDGSPLTAEDVKFSWDRVVKMNLAEGQSSLFTERIRNTKVVDQHTFQVTLKKRDSTFLRTVVLSMAASVVNKDAVEAHGGVVARQPNEWMSQHTAGSGPYKLTEWVRGDHMSFDVFKGYWGTPAHLPVRLDVLVKNPSVGFQAKKYDILPMTPARLPTVEGIPFVKVNTKQMGGQIDLIGFNMKIDPATLPKEDNVPADFFHDPRVRRAFNYAFPYGAFIENVLNGNATRSSFVVANGVAGYDPTAPTYRHNPAKAKQLFKQAGWWNRGFTVSILVDQSNDTFNGAALALKDGVEKLNPNFHVNVSGVPEARFDQLMNKDTIPDTMFSGTSQPLASAQQYFERLAGSHGVWGAQLGFSNGYTDPGMIDGMIDKAGSTIDKDQRRAIYDKLQRVLYDQAMWVLPAQEGLPVGYGEWMTNVAVSALWPRPGLNWALCDKRGDG